MEKIVTKVGKCPVLSVWKLNHFNTFSMSSVVDWKSLFIHSDVKLYTSQRKKTNKKTRQLFMRRIVSAINKLLVMPNDMKTDYSMMMMMILMMVMIDVNVWTSNATEDSDQNIASSMYESSANYGGIMHLELICFYELNQCHWYYERNRFSINIMCWIVLVLVDLFILQMHLVMLQFYRRSSLSLLAVSNCCLISANDIETEHFVIGKHFCFFLYHFQYVNRFHLFDFCSPFSPNQIFSIRVSLGHFLDYHLLSYSNSQSKKRGKRIWIVVKMDFCIV